MIRFNFPHFPQKITSKAEVEALLDQLIPKISLHDSPYSNSATFAVAVTQCSLVRHVLSETFDWIIERRPKIYKRCRHHFFQQLINRLENHTDYWSKVQHEAWKREREPLLASLH